MKKSLVVSLAVFALVGSTMAYAAPRTLSGAEMDAVAAGSGSFVDGFLDAFSDPFGDATAEQATTTQTDNVIVAGENSLGVSATDSRVAAAGAVAATDGTAVNGDRNLLLEQSGNLALGFAAAGQGNIVADQDDSNIAVLATDMASVEAINVEDNDVDDGSAMVIGNGNQTSVMTDNSYIEGAIAGEAQGVIAREATVSDSFNTKLNFYDISVKIDDSFNCVTNTMDISGQNNLSAIVNANTLGAAAIGANLNVTTATASVPTDQMGDAGVMASIPVISGNALALTVQHQVVLNNVAIIGGHVSF